MIERDLEAVVPRHHGVRGLVQQHREVEDDGEREPGDVLPGAEPGLDAARPRGATMTAIRRGDEEPGRRDQHVAARDGADLERPGRTGIGCGGFGHTSRLPGVRRAVGARPRVVAMSVQQESPADPGLDPGRRGRGARCAVAQPGRRLPDLPAALPVPHHRPAARAALARGDPRHRGAQGARGPLRPARRRAHPRAGRARCSRPAWDGAVEQEPELAEMFDGERRGPRSRPGWRPAATVLERYFTLEDPQPARARRA